jgi:hypothetical protein
MKTGRETCTRERRSAIPWACAIATLACIHATPLVAQTTGSGGWVGWNWGRRLPGTPAMSGWVVSGTGAPLPGVLIHDPKMHLGTVTDSVGRFAFDELEAGEHDFRFSLIGHESGHASIVVPSNGSVFVRAVLRFTEGPVECGVREVGWDPPGAPDDLELVVTDARTGLPPDSEVTVRIDHEGESWARTYSVAEMRSATNGLGGGKKIDEAGIYGVEVVAQGYAPWRLDYLYLEPGNACDATLYGSWQEVRLEPRPDP